MPFIYSFLHYLAAINFLGLSLDFIWLNLHPSNFSPAWSFLRSHPSSLSLAPSLLHFVYLILFLENSSSCLTAFSFDSSSANSNLSVWPGQLSPSECRLPINSFLSLPHHRHSAYGFSTDFFAWPNPVWSIASPDQTKPFYRSGWDNKHDMSGLSDKRSGCLSDGDKLFS